MRQYFLFLVLGGLLIACNPFSSGDAGLGEACQDNSDCVSSLICQEGYCEKPGEIDCEVADCTQPGKASQGKDADEDAWGECCDCDDNDSHVKPTAEEIPYNDKDDDCNPYTLDRDLDSDGHDDSEHGGDDCDDSNPQVNPDEAEACNGLDDNCDSQTDEGFDVGQACEGEGECGLGKLECLSDDSSICSTMPGRSEDQSVGEICDGLDNDCDGETDEDAHFLMVPETGEQATDGIDNNCNGLIDEKGGIMVPVNGVPGVWIDAYETTVFENPDCTGARYGESSDDYPAGFPADGQNVSVTLYACSLPGVVPSGYMSRYRVESACEAQGKRLCTGIEYKKGCQLGDAVFPYDSYRLVPGVCNDPLGGVGHVVPTGSYADCSADGSTFDMSGNLAEWVSSMHDTEAGVGYVGGWSYKDEICYHYGVQCHVFDPENEEWFDDMSRSLSCPVSNFNAEEFHIEEAREYFGGRCCKGG